MELVDAARDGGWSSIFVSQHFLGGDTAHLQPAPLLASLISRTGRMELGVGVSLLALGNPVDIAETYGTIDVLSGGRLILGVGLGYRETEFAAFRIERGMRLNRFNTNLECLKRLWSGEVVSLDTSWCTLREERLALLPVQRPRPPIWLAANSDTAVARAARDGDAWLINPHSSVSKIVEQQALYHDERKRAGVPPAERIPLMREIVCARSPDVAAARAARHLSDKYATYRNWGQSRVQPTGEGFSEDFDRLAENRFAIGDPERCVRVLQGWLDRTGATDLVLRVHWAGQPIDHALESIELISRDVIPKLVRTNQREKELR